MAGETDRLTAEVRREKFDFSIWDFAPDEWAGMDREEIRLVDARIEGDKGSESLIVELEAPEVQD